MEAIVNELKLIYFSSGTQFNPIPLAKITNSQKMNPKLSQLNERSNVAEKPVFYAILDEIMALR